ncbi:MAG: hypothetical protein AB1656_23735 [Candidatus Omnitrophota bacterium]
MSILRFNRFLGRVLSFALWATIFGATVQDIYSQTNSTLLRPMSETPTSTPMPKETPTETPTPFSTPISVPASSFLVPNIQGKFITFCNNESSLRMAIDPCTGELFIHEEVSTIKHLIYGPIDPSHPPIDTQSAPIYAELPRVSPSNSYSVRGMIMMPTGDLFLYTNRLEANFLISKNNSITSLSISPQLPDGREFFVFQDLYIVKEGDVIPGTRPGRLIGLVFFRETNESDVTKNLYTFYIIDLEIAGEEMRANVLASYEIYDGYPESFCIGSDRRLYIIIRGNADSSLFFEGVERYPIIFRLEADASFTQVYEEPPQFGSPACLTFWPKDGAFYFFLANHPYVRLRLRRVHPLEGIPITIFESEWYNEPSWHYNTSLSSIDGEYLYIFDKDQKGGNKKFIKELSLTSPFPALTIDPDAMQAHPFPTALPQGPTLTPTFTRTPTATPTFTSTPSMTPTPTLYIPTPTPTPIRAWFVLDGYGGIHSTNPNVKPPLLPYFAPFNIVRDIEPDPLGRGWYMLDGFGGIHTSSPDLPKPAELPYFGFDIARNLEIALMEEGLQFYLLDGYGVVHTTDKHFDYGGLPWLSIDSARDLEPDPNGNGWLMLDSFGYIYSSQRGGYDLPLLIPWFWDPKIRAFVRFPDETTVVTDGYGGRYTNPYHPAMDLLNGLPPNFYFSGFDIIWDIEVVPYQEPQ